MFLSRKTRRENAAQKSAYKKYLSQWGKPERKFRNIHNIFEDWNYKDRRAFKAARRLLEKNKVAALAKKLRQK